MAPLLRSHSLDGTTRKMVHMQTASFLSRPKWTRFRKDIKQSSAHDKFVIDFRWIAAIPNDGESRWGRSRIL